MNEESILKFVNNDINEEEEIEMNVKEENKNCKLIQYTRKMFAVHMYFMLPSVECVTKLEKE